MTDASSTTGGVCIALAMLPAGSHVDSKGLASALGVCVKSVERATRRGELPAPFRLGGKNTWMVGTVLSHFEELQKRALDKQQAHAKKLAQLN